LLVYEQPDGLLLASVKRMNDVAMNHSAWRTAIRTRSLMGLNVVNFFQAEMVGVVLPALGVFLKKIGLA
jgi:hypothetical protein